jgi:malonyl-CoA O-methyltransferase
MVDKAAVSRRFSEQAERYDDHAQAQHFLGQRLMDLLGDPASLSNPGVRLLEVGSGTGCVTRQLLERFPDAIIDAVDLAPGMVAKAKSTISSDRVSFLCADIEETSLARSYAAVVSSATFQWLERPVATVGKLLDALEPGGTLAFSTLASRTFQELRASFAEAAERLDRRQTAYPGLEFLTPNEILSVVNATPGVAVEMHEQVHVTRYASVRALLRGIKHVGATGSSSRPVPPRLLLETERIYATRFGQPGFIPASYHAVWVIAHKLRAVNATP